MTQELKNRIAIVTYVSIICVIMVLTGTIAFAGALAGPAAYGMLTASNKKKLYPTLPEPKDRLTLEQQKQRKVEDWLMTDLPDESSVWDEDKDAAWGLNRFHVELVKDKNWYAAQRVKFLHNEMTKQELEDAFDLAREHEDVAMWQYEVEKQRLAKERAEREKVERLERYKREAAQRKREAEDEARRRKEAAELAEKRRIRLAREEKERKERHARLLKDALDKIPNRSEAFTQEKSRALLEGKLAREKMELSRLRAKKKDLTQSWGGHPSEKLTAFYDAKVKDQAALVKGIKAALTQLEVKATMQEQKRTETFMNSQETEILTVDYDDEVEVDAEVVWL